MLYASYYLLVQLLKPLSGKKIGATPHINFHENLLGRTYAIRPKFASIATLRAVAASSTAASSAARTLLARRRVDPGRRDLSVEHADASGVKKLLADPPADS